MNIDINDELWIYDYNKLKKNFFERVKLGYRKEKVEEMKDIGISDDDIFIAELLGSYKELINKGLLGVG